MENAPRLTRRVLLAGAAAMLAGCANALESGHGTALDHIDLVQMTDEMAASMLGDRRVQAAIAREGALKVVVQPVENRMTGEILPRGEAEMFTARVRALLSKHAGGQFIWVMNRDTFYRLRARELDVPLGPAPDAVNPRYALWAHFHSLTHENAQQRSSAYLCVFELTDLERRTTLWTHDYQVRKVAVKGFLD